MRRLLFGLLASLLVMTLFPAPATAGIRVEQRAYALLVRPERNGTFPAFFVSVTSMDGGGYVGFAIRRGSCFGRATIENCYISDRGGLVGELREGDVFEIDATLGSAHLEVTRKGVTHVVTWEASAAVAPVVRPYDCLVPVGPAAGIGRPASASANLFGRRVRTPDPDAGALEAVAYSC